MLRTAGAVAALIILSAATVGFSAPSLAYTRTDLGGGVFAYDFSIAETDGLLAPYALSVGWHGLGTAGIQQLTVLGVQINSEALATTYDGQSGYSKAGDSWFRSPFVDNPIPGFDPFGGSVITGVVQSSNHYAISAGTDATSFYGDGTPVAHIVVSGQVEWMGTLSRMGLDYSARGATAMPGDINGDGIVDGQDFTILKANFGSSGSWSQGDLTSDGLVDSQDFTVLKSHFGDTSAPVMFAMESYGLVPEPASLLLLGVGGLFTVARRRKTANS